MPSWCMWGTAAPRTDDYDRQPLGTSEELAAIMQALAENPQYQTMQEYRRRLPSWDLREAIVEAVKTNQVGKAPSPWLACSEGWHVMRGMLLSTGGGD
jgi:hypothetical protein